MIARINNYDLVITYSWGNNDHGICGHTFEAIDYYWILKDHFNCCLLFAENFSAGDIERVLRSKYDFDDSEIKLILDNCIFNYKPKIVVTKNILFTDGGMHNQKDIIIKADNKFMFSCSRFESEGYVILEDERIYGRGNIDYKKSILFDRLRTPKRVDDKTLLYLTKNCRQIDVDAFNELSQRDEEFLCIVNNMDNIYQHDKFTYEIAPVDDLFERFNKYIYTPIKRKWDCSPRFIAECKWFGRPVEFYGIDYWDEDLGLKYRVYDIDYDFESIQLKPNNEIVAILGGYIND
jgi:hypothetical protein